MKTAAISTISRDFLLSNYGSFFQHYALRRVLGKMGFRTFRVLRDGEARSWITRFLEGIKNIVRPYYWALSRLPERDKFSRRLRSRKKFLCDYTRLIAPLYEPMVFDDDTIGVKGGDQVLYPGDDTIWLCKLNSNNPRVCYAASCDWQSLERDQYRKDDLQRRLARFSAIGVRESHGVKIISCIMGQKYTVARVADPVLLLKIDEFREIEFKRVVFNKPTLLCYLVNVRNECDLAYDKLLQLAEGLNCELKIIGIQGTDSFIPKDSIALPSPSEFLRAIDDAKYFITNSFHGLVFGLIFQKHLLFVPQRNRPCEDQNERQVELLHRYGLQGRNIDMSASVEEIMSTMITDVDWVGVQRIIEVEREYSIGWLKMSLGI